MQSARMHPRARTVGQVIIHDENRLYIAPLVDISAGGLFVSHLVNLAIGQTVKLVVKGQNLGEPLQAEGTVVRVETQGRKGSAVRFTTLSDAARDLIQSSVFEIRMEAALKAA